MITAGKIDLEKKVALNTKIVPVDNDSFVKTFARFLLEQSFIFNCCTIPLMKFSREGHKIGYIFTIKMNMFKEN